MTDEQAPPPHAFRNASDGIRKGLGMKQGGAAAEKRYGQTYEACVALGLKPKIRNKYK